MTFKVKILDKPPTQCPPHLMGMEDVIARKQIQDAQIALHEELKAVKSWRQWSIDLSRLNFEPTKPRSKNMGLFHFMIVKKELELEIKMLKATLDIERKQLQAEYDILAQKKSMELQQHAKNVEMEAQDKLNKQSTLYNESLQKMVAIHAKEKSELEGKLAKEYYDKMTEAVQTLNLEGSAQSKFVQELSMKMLEKGLEKPMPSHFIEERIVR